MHNYLEGFVIMSRKSCNFALRKSLRRPRACFADTCFSYRAIHCTQKSETCTILTYDVYYFFRAKKHSEPKVGGWKESQIRDVHHTDV